MKNKLIIFSILLLLSGCSLFSPIKTENTNTYLINSAAQPPKKHNPKNINLVVTATQGDSIYNTTEIIYTRQPHQIASFVKSTWAETPTQMLTPLIIKTLRRTQYFHQVDTLGNLPHYHYVLNTQLIKLEQDFTKQPAVLHFIIRAQLQNSFSNNIIASKEFSIDEVLRHNDPYSGVVAANQASAKALTALATFTVKALSSQ